MKLIDISTKKFPGVFCQVDDADFDLLSKWKWSAEKRRNGFYAIRSQKKPGGSRTTIRMHVQIMGESQLEIDHIDGNGLNNQRHNLRHCSPAENQWNSRNRIVASSQHKGVSRYKGYEGWRSEISINGKRKLLGHFLTEDAAAAAYNLAAKEFHGDFALLNTVTEMTAEQVAGFRIVRQKKYKPKNAAALNCSSAF